MSESKTLRLAAWLDSAYEGDAQDAAAELRRQHAELEKIQAERSATLRDLKAAYAAQWNGDFPGFEVTMKRLIEYYTQALAADIKATAERPVPKPAGITPRRGPAK